MKSREPEITPVWESLTELLPCSSLLWWPDELLGTLLPPAYAPRGSPLPDFRTGVAFVVEAVGGDWRKSRLGWPCVCCILDWLLCFVIFFSLLIEFRLRLKFRSLPVFPPPADKLLARL